MADLRADYRREPYSDDADVLSRRLSSSLGRASPKSPTEALQPEAVPPPPTRSRAARHPLVVFLNFVLTVVIVAVVALGGAVFAAKVQFDRASDLDQARAITLERGVSLSAIADQLQKDGVIASKWLFVGGVLLNRQQAALKAGEYLIPAHASMRDIMEAMVSGKGILYSVSMPEGLTSEQIVARLNSEDILEGNIAAVPAEGSLLPETYKFTRGDTKQSIIDRMQRERDRVLADVWAHRAPDLPVTTPEELVVLASIVEKETALSDERSRVAAVFVNRLRLSMRLQSDPTVIYGLFKGAGKPSGFVLSRADLEKQSPYNTYVVNGLPPAPIANPGRASLEAVANPSRTRDLFFVADGSGGHAFAETYEAHLKNVTRWRDISANSGATITGGETAPAPDNSATDSTQPAPRPAITKPPAQTDGIDQPMALTPPAPDDPVDPEAAPGQ
jgi:UPF0755 protein